MGRAQKFKKIRKQEKIEKETRSREKQKILFTTVISLVLIVFGGFWLNSWYQNRNKQENKNGYEAIMHTSMGDIKLSLDSQAAPKTVENFVGLSKEGYYNGTTFHRVIKDFMIQGGDPNSKDDDPNNDGTGGESMWGGKFVDEINPKSLGLTDEEIKNLENQGYKYNYDLNSKKVEKGVIAMANSGPDTNGSQFFIVTEQDQPHLNGKHTVFGNVIEGMDIVSKIAAVEVGESDRPLNAVVINSIDITEKAQGSDGENDLSKNVESDSSVPAVNIGDIQVQTKDGQKINVEKVDL